MIVSEIDYLEHFGVRGQKWGVRKHEEERRARAETFKAQKKMSKKKKAVIGGVVVGTAVVAILLARRSGVTMSSIRGSPKTSAGAKATTHILRNVGKQTVSSVPKTPRKPQMSRETQDFIKNFNRKQTEINRAANAGLKLRDNELDIPVYMRTYLPDWD
jgi:hypothetical protein